MTTPTSPLQIADYRKFWCSRFAASTATTGLVVIIGYQLYDIARSHYGMSVERASFMLGLLGLAQFVPLALLTPLAGVIADRFERRMVAGCAIALDVIVAAGLATASMLALRSLPLLFALAALHGAARVFVAPAQSAIAPNIVPPELLPRAIALSSMAMQAGSIVGPALAGLLYARQGALPYWLAAALLALAAGFVLAIRPLPVRPVSRAHPLRQIVDGFAYVISERMLLGCITLDLFAVLLGGATALMPVFARDILHVGASGLGQLRAAPAIGAAVVGVVLAVRPLAHDVGAKMLAAVAIYGLATIGFGLSRDFHLSLALLALLGAADMVSVFVRSSLIQLNTPDAMRGRVSSISMLGISASNELGEMQSGVAGSLLGPVGAVVLGGAGAIGVALAWAGLFPEMRRAKTFDPVYRKKEAKV